jgi:hypothetical protein
MGHRFLAASLMLVCVLLLPDTGAAKARKKQPKKTAKVALIDSSLLAPGEYAGVLKSVPDSDRTFTLTIHYQAYVPSGKKARRINPILSGVNSTYKQLQQAQQQFANARTSVQAGQAAQKIYNLQAQLDRQVAQARQKLGEAYAAALRDAFKVVNKSLDIEFQARDGVKVRTKVLPEQVDEKGKRKKYTREELRALKGKDKRLPGYESSLENLEAGQPVKVTLTYRKKARASKRRKDIDKKDAEKEKKLQVRMIVILGEADPESAKRPARRKRK